MKMVRLKVEGMTCSACSSGLEKFLKKQKGIFSATVNLVLGMIEVEYENLTVSDIEKYIEQAGFLSQGVYSYADDRKIYQNKKKNLIIFGLLLLFLMYLSMGSMLSLPELFPYSVYPISYGMLLLGISVLFLIYGFDVIKSGFVNLIHRMPNMDTLVLFSVAFSFFYSLYGLVQVWLGSFHFLHQLYFESLCMILYFVKLGRFIENASKDKTTSTIQNLVTITPKKAVMKQGDAFVSVSLDEIKVGDVLVCRPGEKFAVDGDVVDGEGYVDESFITGESVPVLKKKDTLVLAGSVNYDNTIFYQAKKIGKETMVSNIVNMVVASLNQKSKVERIADKISSYFVPFIFGVAVVSFIIKMLLGLSFSVSFHTFVTVLVVACPCALGLAVPLVISVSYGICANKGIVIKKGDVLEKMRDIDKVVFDKTGTLTYGKLSVFKVFSYSVDHYFLLKVVRSLESYSVHPIASAFPKEDLLSVSNFSLISGMGIEGDIEGKHYYVGSLKLLKKLGIRQTYSKDYKNLIGRGCSVLYLADETQVLGLIGVVDVVRENMKEVISQLKELGISSVMLTGDNLEVGKRVAKELGIEEVHADVLPQDKAAIIQRYVSSSNQVVMVGDGVNDAIALVEATVGISVSNGTDVANDASDVILMNHNLSNLVDFIMISKKANLILRENLFWAFFYNICMIPIAVGVLEPWGVVLNPMLASLFMTISSLMVVFNSLRLMKIIK